MPYYFTYKRHIFFPIEKFRCVLNLRNYSPVCRVAWKEPNINTYEVSHQAISFPPPPNFQFSHCLTFLSFRCVQFSPMQRRFTYDAAFKRKVILCAEKIGNRAVGRKYTVSEACVHHWQSIKTKLFSCLTNRKSFSGT
jgi:hypothetical protein